MMQKLMNRRNRKGFTLIELIVVIAIIAILALIAIPRFAGTLTNSKVKADVATGQTIVSAVSVAQTEGTITVTTAGQPTVQELVTGSYLQALPKSAQNKGDFTIVYGTGNVVTSITIGTSGGTAAGTSTIYPAP